MLYPQKQISGYAPGLATLMTRNLQQCIFIDCDVHCPIRVAAAAVAIPASHVSASILPALTY